MAWTELRVNALKALWADGLSGAQIANALGKKCTRSAVIAKVRRLSLEPPKKKAPQSERSTRRSRKRPVPIEVDVAQMCAVAPDDHKVHFMSADNHHCRWPMWNGDEPIEERFYCGTPTADVLDGRPYCAAHSRIAGDGFGRGARSFVPMRAAE